MVILLLEASDGKTRSELDALAPVCNIENVRAMFKDLQQPQYLAIVGRIQPSNSYKKLLARYYHNVELNNDSNLTSGSNLVIMSCMNFNTSWAIPFTHSYIDFFYDEFGANIDAVSMMYLSSNQIAASSIPEIEANVVELGLGVDMAMILFLPFRKVPLMSVMGRIGELGIADILCKVHQFDAYKLSVELAIPIFNMTTDFNLKPIFENMNVVTLFESLNANLTQLTDSRVSSIIHKINFSVTNNSELIPEYKQSLLTFNRPFGFVVIDKIRKTILFAGQQTGSYISKYNYY